MSKPARLLTSEAQEFVLDPKELLLRSGGAQQRSESCLSRAQQEASVIIAQAEARAEEIRQVARQEGYQAGCGQAIHEWRDAVEIIVKQRDAALQQLDEFGKLLERDILELAVQIAEKIVRREIENHEDTVLDTLRQALARLRDRVRVKIWVNKDDLERVRAVRADISTWVEGLHDVEISEDSRVEKGGVIVESGDGILDARPSSMLREIGRKLQDTAGS